MDFWGPLPSRGEYLLVMIDMYSRYPEVEIVRSTSADAVVPHIDKVFSTHGFPEQVLTDGGPPFNGTGSHPYYLYIKWGGVDNRPVAPEDPEANGLAENFMKVIKKISQSALVETTGPRHTHQLEKAQRMLCLVGPLRPDFHNSWKKQRTKT